MKVDRNDNAKLNYNVIPFYFSWNWIRDKQLIHTGNKDYGMLWILNEDGEAVKAYGYELLSNTNEE